MSTTVVEIHSPTAAAIRLGGILFFSALYIPLYAAFLAMGRVHLCRRLARFYWRVVAALAGIRIVVRGAPTPQRPALFVSNHISYLDIVVLGSLLEAAFVAKREIRDWPGFGTIAKLGRTVFVDRRRRTSAQQRDDMVERLAKARESLVLFPEGTSDDGNHVLPFKSALLSVAEILGGDKRGLPVQPISLAYTRLDGMPIGHGWRHFYAWYGAMDLVPHLWTVLGLGTVTVEVEFYPAVTLADFKSRKALSDHCHHLVSTGVGDSNAGRRFVAARPGTSSTNSGVGGLT